MTTSNFRPLILSHKNTHHCYVHVDELISYLLDIKSLVKTAEAKMMLEESITNLGKLKRDCIQNIIKNNTDTPKTGEQSRQIQN